LEADDGEFEEFFRASFAGLVAFVITMGFGLEQAKDAAAEAMVKALES
jgi:DNA-directed RNA polymerase specialized sigma24 family protein